MLNNYANYEIFKEDSCKKKIIITIDDIEYTYAQGSLKLSEGLNSSSQLDFRNAEGSTFKCTIIDRNMLASSLVGKVVKVSVEGTYKGDTSLIPIGTYICTKPTRKDDSTIEIECYDYMSKFDVDVSTWWNSLTFPLNVRQLLIALCARVGVDSSKVPSVFTNSTYTIPTRPTNTNDLTGRTLLGYINEVSACYWRVGRNGELKQFNLNKPSLYPSPDLFPSPDLYPSGGKDGVIERTMLASTSIEEYEVAKIDKVVSRSGDNDVGVIVGLGNNAYIIEDNVLLYASNDSEVRGAIQNIYNQLSEIEFNSLKIDVKYLPYVEVGDKFELTTKNGDIKTYYVFNREVSTFPYGLETISCEIDEYRNTQHSSVNREMQKLNGKVHNIINSVDELTSEIFDESTGLVSRISQTESKISSKVSSGEVTNMISQSLNGVVFESSLTDGSTTINGSCIKTGKISADRIDTSQLVVGGGSQYSPANSVSISTSGVVYCGGVACTADVQISGDFRGDEVYCNEMRVNGIHLGHVSSSPEGYTGDFTLLHGDGTRKVHLYFLYGVLYKVEVS